MLSRYVREWNALDNLLVAVPIAILLYFIHADPALVFVFSGIALVPLASKIGQATEELSIHYGSHAGGLLNVTFGNIVEFFIAALALSHGLVEVVKASIVGTIIGNVLLGLGLALLFGGARYREQRFDTRTAGLNSTLLLLGATAILIPSAFYHFAASARTAQGAAEVEALSVLVAALLLALYLLSMLFSFKTHHYLYNHRLPSKPGWSVRQSLGVLALSTLMVALLAELFVSGIEPLASRWNLSQIFVGAVLVAVIGGATEYLSAIRAALSNNLELSIAMTIGSSIQTALFIAPLLVLGSALLGAPMTLVFPLFEILALLATVLIVNEISSDGQTNWFEGALLCTTYLIMAALFFFI